MQTRTFRFLFTDLRGYTQFPEEHGRCQRPRSWFETPVRVSVTNTRRASKERRRRG